MVMVPRVRARVTPRILPGPRGSTLYRIALTAEQRAVLRHRTRGPSARQSGHLEMIR